MSYIKGELYYLIEKTAHLNKFNTYEYLYIGEDGFIDLKHTTLYSIRVIEDRIIKYGNDSKFLDSNEYSNELNKVSMNNKLINDNSKLIILNSINSHNRSYVDKIINSVKEFINDGMWLTEIYGVISDYKYRNGIDDMYVNVVSSNPKDSITVSKLGNLKSINMKVELIKLKKIGVNLAINNLDKSVRHINDITYFYSKEEALNFVNNTMKQDALDAVMNNFNINTRDSTGDDN